mgnify:CR=1 FL=1
MSFEYTKIEFSTISQITKGKLGFSAIKFSELEPIVSFTARKEDGGDPLLSEIEKEEVVNENKRFYQRLVNDNRTYGIQQFIIKEAIKEYRFKKDLSRIESLGMFPTSTLIAINTFQTESIDDYEKSYLESEIQNGNQISLAYLNDNILQLPKGYKIGLIVDGQHRIAALKELLPKINANLKLGRKKVLEIVDESFLPFLKDRIKNFEFLCTILIDFDIYQQGEIFASVNFNQKPVNRSLYYDIFGSSPNTDRNELKLAHDLVRHLNYNTDSVLYGKIDMLGNGDGIISQSALMELIMKLFGKRKAWHLLYMDYLNEGNLYKILGQFLRLYFSQIKQSFNTYWPTDEQNNRKEYKFVLAKTTGMGALVRLINDIYLDINPKNNKTVEELKLALKERFESIEDNSDLYFSPTSNFVKGAGQGLQSKLYKQIAFDLGYRTSPD